MKCSVIKSFKSGGSIQAVGAVIDVAESMILKMAEYVKPIAAADSYPAEWPHAFKAWLTDNGELRSTGVCDDLADPIRDLTADNMPLQAKLLHQHCGRHHGQGWHAVVGDWRERARHWYESEGYELHQANYKAAEEMQLLCFADELKLRVPE